MILCIRSRILYLNKKRFKKQTFYLKYDLHISCLILPLLTFMELKICFNAYFKAVNIFQDILQTANYVLAGEASSNQKILSED